MQNLEEKYYLRIGRASEIEDLKNRFIYRVLEVLPGFLVWATLIAAIFFSWWRPAFVAFFIIAFDIYWFLRIVHLSFHQISAYRKMKENLKIDWIEKLNNLQIENWRDVYHLVILPTYNEPFEIVDETFRNLINTHYPKDRMIIVLATEQGAGNKADIISRIKDKYQDRFFKLLITSHPQGLEGEIAGKGSNEAWAAKEAKNLIIDPLKIPYENIIVSSLDIDTKVYPYYFACLSYNYLTCQNPIRSSFQPIAFFHNNVWEAPAFSRMAAASATFWQMMQQERPEKLMTFSSHSMAFKALVDIGFWQTNVVSEDSRIFWQAFLFYNGDYRVVPLFYPISMDANLGPNFFQTLKNIYKQQRRWAYGAADIPYMLFGFFKNKKVPIRDKLRFSFFVLEGFWSWACASLLIFALGWLPLWLGGVEFNITLLSYNLPQVTQIIMNLALVGLLISVIINFKIIPSRPKPYSKWKAVFMNLQWLLLPINLIIFGAFPAIEAQTRLMLGKYMGFWATPKDRKSK